MLKLVSSKDPIAARRMREDLWNFTPTHKTILLTNHPPRVKGQDAGIWRRIVLVPWGAKVVEADKDPSFGDRFLPELPGILQWAFEGLQSIGSGGLRPPSAVQAATSGYRAAEDTVLRWLAGECERAPV